MELIPAYDPLQELELHRAFFRAWQAFQDLNKNDRITLEFAAQTLVGHANNLRAYRKREYERQLVSATGELLKAMDDELTPVKA